MKSMWWAQITAVIRLEMKKTFFARRGLWIYVLALFRSCFFLHTGLRSETRSAARPNCARQGEKRLTYADLLAIHPGMSKDEVLATLGKPPIVLHWDKRPAVRRTSESLSRWRSTDIRMVSTTFSSDSLVTRCGV